MDGRTSLVGEEEGITRRLEFNRPWRAGLCRFCRIAFDLALIEVR